MLFSSLFREEILGCGNGYVIGIFIVALEDDVVCRFECGGIGIVGSDRPHDNQLKKSICSYCLRSFAGMNWKAYMS